MGEPERACKAPPQKHSEAFEDAQPAGTAAPSAPETGIGAQTADETPQNDTCMRHSLWEIDAKVCCRFCDPDDMVVNTCIDALD